MLQVLLKRVPRGPHPRVALFPDLGIDRKSGKGGGDIHPEESIRVKEGMVKVEEEGPSAVHASSFFSFPQGFAPATCAS